MICKETLILKPTEIEALTNDVDYEIIDSDETGVYITNNQGDNHHFSPDDQAIYFT